ncbi:MAG: hypothetical protein PVF96_02045 [Candidatus Bathyarchaeota archaeon]|jgi:predicted transcriptional regulator
MIDPILIFTAILFVMTAGSAFEYYRQVRKARQEYYKAKEALDYMVLSFNREIQRQTERIEAINYKVNGNASKSMRALSKLDNIENKFHDLTLEISHTKEGRNEMLIKIKDANEKVSKALKSQEEIMLKISNIESQASRLTKTTELGIEGVIPIKRERALAPLTTTELSVLKLLNIEGPKTAPEVKNQINLSREHTSRLMKKLYEEGYLERNTGKIPFEYYIKEAMKKVLKKVEAEE